MKKNYYAPLTEVFNIHFTSILAGSEPGDANINEENPIPEEAGGAAKYRNQNWGDNWSDDDIEFDDQNNSMW